MRWCWNESFPLIPVEWRRISMTMALITRYHDNSELPWKDSLLPIMQLMVTLSIILFSNFYREIYDIDQSTVSRIYEQVSCAFSARLNDFCAQSPRPRSELAERWWIFTSKPIFRFCTVCFVLWGYFTGLQRDNVSPEKVSMPQLACYYLEGKTFITVWENWFLQNT